MSPLRGLIFPFHFFYKDKSATLLSFQQRSCNIFVDKCLIKFLKQRSCDILIGFNYNRAIVLYIS